MKLSSRPAKLSKKVRMGVMEMKKPTATELEIGRRIKRIRLSRGMTLEEFSNLFNPAPGTSVISKWERGMSKPNPKRIKRLADISGMAVEELMEPAQSEFLLSSLQNIQDHYEENKADIKHSLTNSYLLERLFNKYIDLATLKNPKYLESFEDVLSTIDSITSSENRTLFSKSNAQEAAAKTLEAAFKTLEKNTNKA